MYGGAAELRETLEYDFQTEREFSYANLSMNEIIIHLARFVSRLWQIHIFGEGNTCTTAVFFIKYIRSLGFHATNDVFAKNAWYFRNALVRANYSDLGAGIYEDLSYLENFLRNLLMGASYELKNRYLHIAWKESAYSDEKQPIKQPIEHIEENSLSEVFKTKTVSSRTKANIARLYDEFGNEKIFGRGDVSAVLGITERRATTLVGRMYELEAFCPIIPDTLQVNYRMPNGDLVVHIITKAPKPDAGKNPFRERGCFNNSKDGADEEGCHCRQRNLRT